MDLETCMKAYLKELEEEVMRILSDPKTDKKTKNLAMKPLSSKKRIIINTMDALKMVDQAHEEELRRSEGA